MELLILLIIALILLAWRINSEMSAIQPLSYPLVQKQQEDQSNSVPTEDEEDRMKKHSSVDGSHNDWSADSFFSSSFLDDDDRSSSSNDDIYTDPFYCHLPENIYYHMCHNRNIIRLFFDDDNGSDDWGSSSWDSWDSSSWDS